MNRLSVLKKPFYTTKHLGGAEEFESATPLVLALIRDTRSEETRV